MKRTLVVAALMVLASANTYIAGSSSGMSGYVGSTESNSRVIVDSRGNGRAAQDGGDGRTGRTAEGGDTRNGRVGSNDSSNGYLAGFNRGNGAKA